MHIADVMDVVNGATTEAIQDFRQTDIGLMPVDWQVVPLGDLFEIQQGKAVSPRHRRGLNLRPFLRTANVHWGRIDTTRVDYMDFNDSEVEHLALQDGDLLVCEGGDIGRTAMWEGQLPLCLFQNHLHRLRAKRPDLEPRFYMYWMEAAWRLLKLYSGAGNKTTIPNLSKSRLAAFLVPFPPPHEQRAIAQILRTIQESREMTGKVILAAHELKKSLMRHLFTHGPEPVEEAVRVPLKEAEVGLVPQHWQVRRVGDLAERMKAGGTPSRKNAEFWGGEIPFVLIEDMTSCGLYLRSTKETITEEGLNKSSAWLVPPRSLLLSMYATIGETAVNVIPVATNQAILAIIPTDDWDVRFAAYQMKHYAGALARRNVQSTQKNVNRGIVEQFPVPLPPLSEQHRIVDVLWRVDRKIEAEERRKEVLDALFEALLHHLSTGKLRIRTFPAPSRKAVSPDVSRQ